MGEERLAEELKRLNSIATHGPWRYDGIVYIFGPNMEMIAMAQDEGPEVIMVRGTGAQLPQAENAALITTLRNHVPEIIAALAQAAAHSNKAWLIERKINGRAHWWSRAEWTTDAAMAVWFVREADAADVLAFMSFQDECYLTEHLFIDDATEARWAERDRLLAEVKSLEDDKRTLQARVRDLEATLDAQ